MPARPALLLLETRELDHECLWLKCRPLGRLPGFCRSERSEGPHRCWQPEHFTTPGDKILRCAQDDRMDTGSAPHETITL